MKTSYEFIANARQLIRLFALFLASVAMQGAAHAQQSFAADAASVNSATIAETYCSSIDGVDFSLDTYFPNQAAAESKFGKAIVSRGAGVCCTGANPLLSGGACQACPSGTEYSGGACVATTTSCAAIGQILVNGKCQVAVPCPTSEGWFSGGYSIQTWYNVPLGFAYQIGASVTSNAAGAGVSQQRFNLDQIKYNGSYEYAFTFNVSDVNKIGEYRIIESAVDDAMLIEVNGRAVRAAPAALWEGAPAPWDFPRGAVGLRLVDGGAQTSVPSNNDVIWNGQPQIYLARPSDLTQTVDANGNPASYLDISAMAYNNLIGVTPWSRTFYAGGIGGSVYITTSVYLPEYGISIIYGAPIRGGMTDMMGAPAEVANVDLKPWLKNGQNQIHVQRFVIGAGSPSSFVIQRSSSIAGCN